jgi:cytosine/adenosine deaminase-related metal-dependent hydrolase/ubiquinone/menaquinone biosynthesis C-methylase UbiE
MTASAKVPALANGEDQKREFALWSRLYDEAPNPMLMLEERFLAPILSQIQDRDVMDIGCGTGRWLERLATRGPRSLKGVDISPEMLDRARQKLERRARLVVGSATSLPTASLSADVVLASFLASYVADLPAFANQLRQIVRSDGRIYISDVHPETATACNWKRGFRVGTQRIEPATFPRSLPQIISCFRGAGFEVSSQLEPPFGVAELETFRSEGKLEAFYAAAGLPAIFILELRLVESHRTSTAVGRSTSVGITLSGARVALDAETTITADVAVQNDKLSSILSSNSLRSGRAAAKTQWLNLEGYLLLPGLINAHDHLEFGLYPNLGRGLYRDSAEWARDIQQHESAKIAAHQSVPRHIRLWWGALRNLLCGVTTVCHHNPLHPDLLADNFPLRVLSNYGWAHSLAMDTDIAAKFNAVPSDAPFVLHGCEGTAESCAREVFELDELGVLEGRTVLVHGLALDGNGVALLNRRRAALVWCPTSNRFLFGRTLTRETIASVHQCLMGSDSPLTAAGDLLDEIRVAHRDVGLDAGEIYQMLFERPAGAFRLTEGQGFIRTEAGADVIAVRDRGLSPAETLADLATRDVELVMVRGRVQLASDEILRRLPAELTAGLSPLEVDSTLRWVRVPLGRMFREAERALGCEIKIGGKRVRHVCTAWL